MRFVILTSLLIAANCYALPMYHLEVNTTSLTKQLHKKLPNMHRDEKLMKNAFTYGGKDITTNSHQAISPLSIIV